VVDVSNNSYVSDGDGQVRLILPSIHL
jgi:hypothetical protein